jgi:hypothetical protein
MTSMRRLFIAVLTACATVASVTAAHGQTSNPLPAALGMSESYTAAARGYAAVAWNPAALGLTGGPETSAMIGAVRGLSGLGPVTLGDLGTWQDEAVPLQVRQQWLADIKRSGGQAGAAGFDFTWAAFQVGRFAAQVSSSGRALNDISAGVAELILMGNADASGTPVDIDLAGSLLDAQVHTTGALSFGMPLPLTAGAPRVAVGVTAKYTLGHVLGVSQESAGVATGDPVGINFRFPVVYTPVVYGDMNQYWLSSGGGWGLDLAVAAELGRLSVAAVAHNVVNRFSWDPAKLRFRSLEMTFSDQDTETSVEWQPLSAAPAELRALVDASTFQPSFAAGAALQWSPRLLVTADARIGSTDGMHTRAPVHAGAGVEVRPLPWLPLQAGASWADFGAGRDGVQLGAGLGVDLGSFQISISAARRAVAFGNEDSAMLSLLSHTF